MRLGRALWFFILAAVTFPAGTASAQQQLEGQVLGGGAPIVRASVALFAASSSTPAGLSRTETDPQGHFTINYTRPQSDAILYLVATGGEPAANAGSGNNPDIALLTVVGATPPPTVIINEMTTAASVWTHAQFLDGTAIRGHSLGLKIAAGNVRNFVDLQTGGWGPTIQDPLNSGQTPTMANFATLADLLSGCATRVKPDACSRLFAAATPPTGSAPTDTLTAAQAIAR
jgi:hypothetical protein